MTSQRVERLSLLSPGTNHTKRTGSNTHHSANRLGRFVTRPTSLAIWYRKLAMPTGPIVRSFSQLRVHGGVHLAIAAVLLRGEYDMTAHRIVLSSAVRHYRPGLGWRASVLDRVATRSGLQLASSELTMSRSSRTCVRSAAALAVAGCTVKQGDVDRASLHLNCWCCTAALWADTMNSRHFDSKTTLLADMHTGLS